jgi:GntR family transcriptional regulator
MGAASPGGTKCPKVCYMPPQPPTYRQIADDLRARIRGGEYAPGDELPMLAEFKVRYDVGAVNTVRQALAILVAEGLVDSRGGRRSKVADPLPPEGVPSESERVQAQIAGLQEQIAELRERLAGHERDGGHSGGAPI